MEFEEKIILLAFTSNVLQSNKRVKENVTEIIKNKSKYKMLLFGLF
jgi:hypothetical protein